MNFWVAVKTCLIKYATFEGRATRSEYWYWVLFVILLGSIALLLDMHVFKDANILTCYRIFHLAVFVPGIAVTVRRLHDVGRSGWWLLLVPTIVGAFLVFYWELKLSDVKKNNFGPPSENV